MVELKQQKIKEKSGGGEESENDRSTGLRIIQLYIIIDVAHRTR